MTQPAKPESARSRGALLPFVVVVGAMAAVAAGVLAVVRASDSGPAPGANPDAPAIAAVDIKSDPTGAIVLREDDGGVLGTTPMTTSLPLRGAELPVIVRHVGYKDRRVIVPLYAASGRIDVTLTAVGAKDPEPPKALPDGWTP